MELPPYLRLQQSDDVETAGGNEGGGSQAVGVSTSNPLHAARSAGETFVLRVLHKESKVEINTLSPHSTVSELKAAIQKQTEIPAMNQRLIFSGKHLNPDSKSLNEFNIVNQSSIHLFPRPTAAPAPQQQDAQASPGRARILRIHNISGPQQAGLFGDYDTRAAQHGGLHQTVPEVRLWCYILFFYSFMTLFSHLSFVANTGTLGRSILDGLVNTLETIFAGCGIYVSHMGLKATQTTDRQDVKRYVYMLMALAVCVISSRALWIVDMIIQAKIGIREEAEKRESEEEEGSGDGHDDPYSNDDYYGGPHELSPSTLLFYFSVQVVIMAFIYSSMWVFCVSRAVRFRMVVEEQSADQAQAPNTV